MDSYMANYVIQKVGTISWIRVEGSLKYMVTSLGSCVKLPLNQYSILQQAYS
jgi:hypothetical protein